LAPKHAALNFQRVLPDNDEITDALQILIGQPIGRSRRAANMQIFSFGQLITSHNRKGEQIEIETFALHVQCQWRFTAQGRILFGRHDLWLPADERIALDEFDYDKQPSRLDITQRQVFASLMNVGATVTAAGATQYGGFSIEIGGVSTLEAWPSGSADKSELWRLFRNEEESQHFVVKANGVLR
jgi:hypothetical protein